MLIKPLLTIPFCVLLFSNTFAQETRITGSLPSDFTSIQVITYRNPFSDNIIGLAEIETTNGKFEVSFPLATKKTIVFQSGNYTASLDLKPNVSYTINFKKGEGHKKLSQKSLLVSNITSNDENTNEILRIEKEIDEIRLGFKKGIRSSKYEQSLSKYLVDQLDLMKDNEALLKEYTNSTSFGSQLSYLKSSDQETYFKKLEAIYEENMEFNFSGMKTVNTIYVNEIVSLYFFSKDKKADYFEITSKSIEKIQNKKLQEAVTFLTIAQAYRIFSSQSSVLNQKLINFKATCQDSALKEYAEKLLKSHNSNLIGTKLKNLNLIDLSNQNISFNDYKGTYLLLDFWATWCGPCVKSMKLLPHIKENLETELSILCISNDSPLEKMKTFVAKNNYNTSMDFAYAENKLEMNSYFEKQAIPLYYLISPEGIIIAKAVKDPTAMIKEHLK